jgi:hypothetical protein
LPGNIGTLGLDINAIYDNSPAFAKFLKKQFLDEILRETRLRLREIHSIVPHVSTRPVLTFSFGETERGPAQRVKAPLAGRPGALPELEDEELWYYYVCIQTSHGLSSELLYLTSMFRRRWLPRQVTSVL